MFADFTQAQLEELALIVGLAALPAVIWSTVLFRGRKTSRWILLLAFFLGTLTVLPLIFLYDVVFVYFPELNIYNLIEENVVQAGFAALATLSVVGILEEFVKSGVVRVLGRSRIGIQTVNDAVKYSILAGLGFAFVENIVYFYQIWETSNGLGAFLFPVIFRSIFTVCGHMVFSGIFGYFYGIAQFARPILETDLWMGSRSTGIKWLARIFGSNEAEIFKEFTIFKGLIIAMATHASFDLALEFEQFFPVVIIVVGGFFYLLYLLAHKAGDIVFAASGGKQASMAHQDVDVVLELLGMWTREGRYTDVVDICQRLLVRDPDNKVVQLFQAKALDQKKLADLETSFTSLFEAKAVGGDEQSLRTLVKQKVLMEMLKEKQGAVRQAEVRAANALMNGEVAMEQAQVDAPTVAPQNRPSSPQ